MSPFNIDLDGKRIVTNYVAKHNHSLCGVSEQHLLRPYRKALTDGLFVGFQLKDFHNRFEVDDKKSFDGDDTNSLIEIFDKQFNNEIVCFHDFGVDVNGCLVTFLLGLISRC